MHTRENTNTYQSFCVNSAKRLFFPRRTDRSNSQQRFSIDLSNKLRLPFHKLRQEYGRAQSWKTLSPTLKKTFTAGLQLRPLQPKEEVKEMSKHFVTEWTVSKPKHGKISL